MDTPQAQHAISTFSDLGLEGQSQDSTAAGPSNANGAVMETGSARDKSEADKLEEVKLEEVKLEDKREKDKNRKESADSDKVKRFHSLIKMYPPPSCEGGC